MVTRFLPELENGERQKFTAEVEGFNIEILFKNNGYMSYDPTHFDDMYDNLPNFDLRVRLSNIKSDDYHFDVQDATIPLGKQFNELGLPNIGDHILFTSRPATQDGLIKAFKYVNNVKYLNEDIHPVIQDQQIDFELLGYLIVERMFDIQFVRNQHGKIRKIGINRIKPLIDYCKKRYLRKIKHQRDQKLMMVESDIFQKENIQEYRNTNDCNDKIYVQRGKIIDQDKICLIIAKNLKDRFGQETKQQFCEKFANDNHTIDTSALALRKTIRAIIDDYNA